MTNTIARNFTDYAVSARRNDTNLALDSLVRGLSQLYYVIGKSDFLDDTICGLLDQVTNIQHGLDTDLDNAGLDPSVPEPIDISEVEALLAKVRS